MLKFSRYVPVLLLLALIYGCGGSKSQSTQTDSSPVAPSAQAPITQTESQSQQPTAEATQKTADQSTVPPAESGSQSKSAPKSGAVTAKKAPPAPEPTPLPDLSDSDKAVVSQVTKEVQAETPVSKENPGLITVNRVLLAQEAMWVLSGSFSTDFEALEPNLPIETDQYQFMITQGDEAQAVVKAIAKTDKLHSFTGVAVAVPEQVPESAMCRTPKPSKTPPEAPRFSDGQVVCANDSVLVGG